jgi:hypothetical protein
MGEQRVIVPIGKTVTFVFTPDDRAIAPDAYSDFGEAQAGVAAPHHLDALFKTDPMSRASWPRQITRISQSTKSAAAFA